MPFDPDKFLEETGGFDPDKFLQETGDQPISSDATAKPKKHWLESLFPTASKTASEPLSAKTALVVPQMALDAASIPTRALAAARGQDFSDLTSYILKPEVEKLSGKLTGKTFSDKEWPSSSRFGGPERRFTPEQTKESQSVALDVLGGTFSDPTVLAGLAKRAVGGASKKLGKRVEEGVIGKGGSAIGKKQNVKLPDVAENVLKHGAGGDMQTTINKANEIMNGLDDKIDDVLRNIDYKANPDNLTNIDGVIDNLIKKVQTDKQYIADYKTLVPALEEWRNDLKTYGYSGYLTPQQTQEAKRLFKGTAFKSKGIPEPGMQAKEFAADEIKLALTGELDRIAPEVKEINKVYRELIPAKKIAQRRLWTETAQYPITLGDIAATGVGAGLGAASGMAGKDGEIDWNRVLAGLATGGIYRALRSGGSAQRMYDFGDALSRSPLRPPVGGITTGIRSARERKE